MPPAPPAENVLQPQPLELDEGQKTALTACVQKELSAALINHRKRKEFLARLLRAYKAIPDVEVKNFPWPNASNVVVPIVAITVDTVSSRLQRAVLGAKDPCEVELNTKTPFLMMVPPDPNDPQAQPIPQQVPLQEKDVRDWCKWILTGTSNRDSVRAIFCDLPLYGDAFVSPRWVDDVKIYHAYDPTGQVVEQEVPAYVGVHWDVHSATDIVFPTGFDEWHQLPWQAIELRYSWPELNKFVEDGAFQLEDIKKLRPKAREDKVRQVQKKAEKTDDGAEDIYTLYELRGIFEIKATQEGGQSVFEEVVLTYSLEQNLMMRAIYNPYFGKTRHLIKMPYLAQPHEIISVGAAEQALPFQDEATTSHNQVIDAATSANAGISVVSNTTNVQANEEIWPGKTIFTDGPAKDGLSIAHLSEPSVALGQVEEKAFFMAEKRTGVSVYNMGMESPTVGSRATATGTTALINEGNMRFWVSIDDMRYAIEELLYLTIQLEQQMRPEGYYFEKGRYIQFPQGDPRQVIALRLSISSESVNRDIEVAQMQMLMQVCNDYYQRLNQAMMLIMNPQFPPQAKMMAAETMMASSIIVKKFVERFDIEDLDAVVPTVMSALQSMGGMLGAMQGGPPGMGQPPQAPQGPVRPGAPGGPRPMAGPPAGVQRPPGSPPPPGGGSVPVQ